MPTETAQTSFFSENGPKLNPKRFGSKNHSWATPDRLFLKLNSEFGFTLDAAATIDNTKCEKFLSINENALMQPWPGIVWLNPPYGRDIKKWIAKAISESKKGSTIVCLVPSRTDTVFFQRMAFPEASEIRFIKGRIKFIGATETAPFASILIIFTPLGGPAKFSNYSF